MTETIKIPYSSDQYNALVDSCLYGIPYGFCLGERDEIQKEMKKLGLDMKEYEYVDMDDKNYQHILRKK